MLLGENRVKPLSEVKQGVFPQRRINLQPVSFKEQGTLRGTCQLVAGRSSKMSSDFSDFSWDIQKERLCPPLSTFPSGIALNRW